MTTHGSDGEGGVVERFEYFMVRLTRSAREPDRLAGLIERLGSGEKRSFDTGEQFVRLVYGGFTLNLNMQPAGGDRNATQSETPLYWKSVGPSLSPTIGVYIPTSELIKAANGRNHNRLWQRNLTVRLTAGCARRAKIGLSR